MNLLYNEGRNQRNLARSWDLSSRPELQLLLGQPVKGDWVLKARDLAAQDAGILKRWSVRLNYA
jgi:subtilisin-like proprotein convertase family protein